eukprot:7880000-Pyramimonas_sp.AAC.1
MSPARIPSATERKRARPRASPARPASPPSGPAIALPRRHAARRSCRCPGVPRAQPCTHRDPVVAVSAAEYRIAAMMARLRRPPPAIALPAHSTDSGSCAPAPPRPL